jgi:hypothetical protein
MSLIADHSVEVTRYAAGSRVDGRYVPGASTTWTIACSGRQPIGGYERVLLPEGVRERATHKLYTSGDIAVDDEVELEGGTYVVTDIREQTRVIQHKKVFLQRKVTG